MKALTLALLITFSTLTGARAEWEIYDAGMPAQIKSVTAMTSTQPVGPSITPGAQR